VKKFSEFNQSRIAVVGVTVAALIVAVSLNVSKISAAFETHYAAEFERGGGIRSGDPVRVSGVTVGVVRDVALQDDHVEVVFTADGIHLGAETSARIRSDNALGAKFLDLEPAGDGSLETIPVDRTEGSYDVTNALADLTRAEEDLDVGQLAESLDTLATTFDGTTPALKSAIVGVGRISESVALRDEELRRLFRNANSVSALLADRSQDIMQIVTDGNALLRELAARRLVIRDLLANAEAATHQLRGLVTDHDDTLKPALEKVRGLAEILERNKANLSFVLSHLAPYARSVGESVGAGPFYFAYVANLVATDIAPIIPDLIRNEEP